MTLDLPGQPRRVITGSAPAYVDYESNSLFSDAGERGLAISNVRQWRARDIEISRMRGACIDYQGPSEWWDGALISGVYLHDSWKGIWTRNGGEGLACMAPVVSRCVFGIHVDSGNNNFTNGQVTKCSIGVLVSGGANDAHGSFSAMSVRHCTYLLSCQQVTLGEAFSGCNFIGGQAGTDQGIVQIVNSRGIALNGGQIAYANITVDATSQLALRGVTFRGPVNVNVAAGGQFDAKDSLVMAGASLTLNGAAWNGNN